MTADRNQRDHTETFPDETVRRLLKRATELEATRSTELSLAELREVAREVGIAPHALEQAIAELRSHPVADTEPSAIEPKKRFELRLGPGTLLTAGLIAGAILVAVLTLIPMWAALR